ncbi:DoxX family protein [Maribacter sp. 2304DJ31-5]|uniref:DoxX family protein n=1 Tax=Maribacter sp. 2304DJ31-5 TaxID=3386273 RepID=UPI0039BC4F77
MEILLISATEILLLLFLIITFLQSGVDKIMDWQGNLSWLKGHFSKTPLKNMVPALLSIVMLTEVVAAALCTMGAYQLLVGGGKTTAFYGAILSCLTLLMLLFGQRMAKDYEGAKTIAIYFVPAIFLVFLLQS